MFFSFNFGKKKKLIRSTHAHTHTISFYLSLSHSLSLSLSLTHTHNNTRITRNYTQIHTYSHIRTMTHALLHMPNEFCIKNFFFSNFPSDPNGNWLDVRVTERRDIFQLFKTSLDFFYVQTVIEKWWSKEDSKYIYTA